MLDPVRRPRCDVLKEGGFSSKFKDAFNALLSDVIPCGGGGLAVRWLQREASLAGPDERKLRSKTLFYVIGFVPAAPACARGGSPASFGRTDLTRPGRRRGEGWVSRALRASHSCDHPSREKKGVTLTLIPRTSLAAPDCRSKCLPKSNSVNRSRGGDTFHQPRIIVTAVTPARSY